MIDIIYFTSVTHTVNNKNLNSFQRIYFLSRYTNLTIIACRGANFSQSANKNCPVYNAPFPGKLGLILYGFFWLIRHRKNREIDVIITEPSIIGLLGFFGKYICSTKWIVDVWDIPFRCHSPSILKYLRIKSTKAISKVLYRYADLFIVSILPDFELRYFNIPKSKMLLLNNAIWLDNSFPVEGRKCESNYFNIFCMRSYYTKDMGIDILSDAFVQLKSKISNISLTIVGEIPKEVKPQIQELWNYKDVVFTGFIGLEKLNELIIYADICVVPFRDIPDLVQTYPTKILQYLFLGKPIVASRIAGIKTMIEDGYNGLLFNPGDVDDLANKIELLYKDENLREKISENASNLDSKYDCRVKNRIILNTIHQLIVK